MSRIAFLLLCHKNAPRVLDQIRMLTSMGDAVAVHIDGNAGPDFYREVHQGARDIPGVTFAKRVACGWGEWSLVAASLNMIEAALNAFDDATHFFLISGDCMPIKPVSHIRAQLEADGRDMIEHADFMTDNWIKTGLTEDRLIYRHWFNERRQKRLFYGALAIQRSLGLTRSIPKGLRIKIGSQWWVLRRSTIEAIRDAIAKRPEILRFFRTTWIPDETFFQTMVMHTVPREEVISEPPTYLMFSDYGMPITFYADHLELLKAQSQFFARKISENDGALREALGAHFQSNALVAATEGTGRALYDYVRQRGRIGKRFAPRIWENEARLGPDREVILIVAKKWHIGNRISDALRDTGIPAFGYVFDDEILPLPDLGGIENSREKRCLHRRVFLNLLFRQTASNRLAICIDPSNVAAIKDLRNDGCGLRVLGVETELTSDWLAEHAERIGLGSRTANGALQSGLLVTLRENIEDERDALRALDLPHYTRITEGMEPGEMARPLAKGLGIPVDAGGVVARGIGDWR